MTPRSCSRSTASGIPCPYFELMGDDAHFNEELGPDEGTPEIAKRAASDHWPTKLQALQAAFLLEHPAKVNTMLSTLKSEFAAKAGGVFLIQTGKRLQRRKAMIRVLHAAQAQPDRSFEDLNGEAQPLEEHSPGSDSLHHYLYAPAVLLPSPFIRGFTAGRIIPEATESHTLVALHAPGTPHRLIETCRPGRRCSRAASRRSETSDWRTRGGSCS